MTRTGMLLGVLLPLSGIGCASLKDIRPEALRQADDLAERDARGRALVARMQDAHGGLERWLGYERAEAEFSDEWHNGLFFALAAPYHDNPAQGRVTTWLHHFPYARIEMTGEEDRGVVWRVRGSRLDVYEGEGQARTQRDADDWNFAVFVHNPELMIGTALRLHTADHFASLGPGEYRGRRYERVMISWGSLEPQREIDQWILWIDAETHRLGGAQFTVRRSGEGVGPVFYRFDDMVEVEGFVIPRLMEAFLSIEDDAPLHTYRFSKIRLM